MSKESKNEPAEKIRHLDKERCLTIRADERGQETKPAWLGEHPSERAQRFGRAGQKILSQEECPPPRR